MARFDLTDFEWSVIEPLLPNKPRGVPRVDDRRVLDGIFWRLRSRAPELTFRSYGPRPASTASTVAILSALFAGLNHDARDPARFFEVSGRRHAYFPRLVPTSKFARASREGIAAYARISQAIRVPWMLEISPLLLKTEMKLISDNFIRILFVISAVLPGVTLLPKLANNELGNNLPYFSDHPLILFFLVPLITILPFFFPVALRWYRAIAPITLLGFIAFALILQPAIEKLHGMGPLGRGNDQGTCLIVGAQRLLALQWPYDAAAMYSHNPMSCGPGWVILFTPLLSLLSYPLTMLIFIIGCTGLISYFAGLERALRYIAITGLVPSTWHSLANGSDFLTFAFCIVVIIVATEHVSGMLRWVLSIFIILVSQFRLPFIFLPFLRYFGASNRLLVSSGLMSLMIWGAFFLINPVSFISDGPMHVLSKFQGMVDQWPWFTFFLGLLVGIGMLIALFALYRYPDAIVIYVVSILWPMSVLDFVAQFQKFHNLIQAGQHWEGGTWLAAVANIVAWFLVQPASQRGLGAKS